MPRVTGDRGIDETTAGVPLIRPVVAYAYRVILASRCMNVHAARSMASRISARQRFPHVSG